MRGKFLVAISGRFFVDDPNGVMIELNYEAAKEVSVSAPRNRR